MQQQRHMPINTKADVERNDRKHKLEQEIQSEAKKSVKICKQEIQSEVVKIYKRKRKEQEKQSKVVNVYKRKRKEQEIEESCNADRFTSLPESLQLYIPSSLDAKKAVQTSILSKSFKSLWASIPVLNFCSYVGFEWKQLRAFDKFVEMVLSKRDNSVSLERLSFNRHGSCSSKMLETVFGCALSHGVRELEASIADSRKHAWPDFLNYTSTDSLITLILTSKKCDLDCPFLGPQSSGLFKNLSVLYLEMGIIRYLEPSSGFPALEKLTLIDCIVETDGNNLNINAMNLSELKISCYKSPSWCNLTTPKLRIFEFKSYRFPLFKTYVDLPILDTVVIGQPDNLYYNNDNEQKIEDMMCMLRAVHSAKSFGVFSSVVMQLSLFQDRSFDPFQVLKLNLTHHLDHENFLDNTCRWLSDSLESPLIDGHSCSVMMRNPYFKHPKECLKCSLLRRSPTVAMAPALKPYGVGRSTLSGWRPGVKGRRRRPVLRGWRWLAVF